MFANGHIRPADLRSFSNRTCRALDLFLVNGSRATSCQNESFIEADSSEELVELLRAVPFWSREKGRLHADIDWTFTLLDDVSYKPTALPNTSASPVQSPASWTVRELLAALTAPELWKLVAAAATLLAAAFSAGYWVGGLNGQQKGATAQAASATDLAPASPTTGRKAPTEQVQRLEARVEITLSAEWGKVGRPSSPGILVVRENDPAVEITVSRTGAPPRGLGLFTSSAVRLDPVGRESIRLAYQAEANAGSWIFGVSASSIESFSMRAVDLTGLQESAAADGKLLLESVSVKFFINGKRRSSFLATPYREVDALSPGTTLQWKENGS